MKVLVTGVTRNTGLAVIRGLARKGCQVKGCDERHLPFGMHSRYVTTCYDYPCRHGDGFMDAILNIIRKEKPDVFIPVTGTRVLVNHKEALQRYTKVLLPDADSYEKAFDNTMTLDACRRLGIKCPQLLEEADVRSEFRRNRMRNDTLRFVLKPKADIGGSRGMGIFHDVKTLDECKASAKKYGEILIQEYIPGPTENMRTVNLLFDKENNLRASFTTRKLRQWPNYGGITTLSVSTHEPELIDFIMPFFQENPWQGFAEVEIKIDERDNKPRLIEINPRFCGYIGFPIACGINFPWYICQVLQGEKIEKVYYPAGVRYIHWPSYLKAAYHQWRTTPNRKLFYRQIRMEIKGEKVSNTLGWKDWKVTLAKIINELKVTVEDT